MSVEACKWARMADVQKSSSKLILLSLAQLVRYDAQDWTVFASIEYLAKVTHLNRKTVIEALARLRQLGAIQDTLMRAGENRSSVVYRLCPNAVPRIDMTSSARQADYQQPSAPAQQALTLEASTPGFNDDTSNTVEQVEHGIPNPLSREQTVGASGADVPTMHVANRSAISEAEHAPTVTVSAVDNSLAEQPSLAMTSSLPASPAQIRGASAHGSRRLSTRGRHCGAGPTRLPAGWSLPTRWRIWAQRERPHWTAEKIDAMAATFSAYMRSRPGDAGMSEDWFESWRLWVFREREKHSTPRKAWQNSWAGIVAKGKALGLEQASDEPAPYFKARVFRAAGLAPPP